jgi:4-amino-4-deoxy-L-arabinose transferase-like glycosyltransferase
MNIIASALPLLLFMILWGIFYELQKNWRSSFLSAGVLWGTLLTGSTEVLSLFKWITFWPVAGVWSLFLIMGLCMWGRTVGNPKHLFKGFSWAGFPRTELLLLSGMGLIAGLLGLIALVAPPTTWDSMTYHLARVMHWIQNQSVANYPTHILRQLFLNPGSEFIFLHFQILSGTDRLANFVQWVSMIGSAVGVSLIAERLDASRRGQVFSAVISMTIPMGILQGSSTQNDYAATFWMVCFVYFLFALTSEMNLSNTLAGGASLGLAILTKATIYLYGLPFILWLGFGLLKTNLARGTRLLGILAALTLLLNLGHYVRNYNLFGSPLGPAADISSTGTEIKYFKYANDVFNLPVLISNSVRNVAINIGTPFAPINKLSNLGVALVHSSLGLSLNDPRTTWPDTQFQIPDPSFNEDSAGNPLQVILIVFAICMIAFKIPRRRAVIIYCLSLIIGFLLFSFYLRWQPWNSRLELPLFVLWSAPIGSYLADLRRKWVGNVTMIVLFLAALPWVFLSESRPLIGSQNIFNMDRTEQYFRTQHSLWFTYSRVASNLSGDQCKQIGLYFDGGTWEYPLWILLQQDIGKDVRIESVNVGNISAIEAGRFPPFAPCAVLVASPLPISNFRVGTTAYALSLSTKYMSILTPK